MSEARRPTGDGMGAWSAAGVTVALTVCWSRVLWGSGAVASIAASAAAAALGTGGVGVRMSEPQFVGTVSAESRSEAKSEGVPWAVTQIDDSTCYIYEHTTH